MVDGGIRRGSDVIKALALGANAVLIGRPILYALTVGGEAAVDALLALVHDEIVNAMALLGCPTLSDISPHQIAASG